MIIFALGFVHEMAAVLSLVDERAEMILLILKQLIFSYLLIWIKYNSATL